MDPNTTKLKPKPAKSLRPLDLKTQPAPFQDRFKMTHKIFETLHQHAPAKALKNGNGLVLERIAVDLEARVARSSKTLQSYRFNLSVLLRDLVKYKCNLKLIKVCGVPLVGNKRVARSTTRSQVPPRPAAAAVTDTVSSIITRAKAIESSKSLLLDRNLLEKHGYIMDRYTMEPTTTDGSTSSTTGNYVECCRCGTKFEKTKILESTLCTYHPAKRIFNKETKSYTYPCCGETSDSASFRRLGCCQFQHHVFKANTYFELRSISEFLKTSVIEGNENVLALDCEMAYTSEGFEMVRLTIVDFFTSRVLFDSIVRPFGEVVDLNSQFSGIHEIDPLYSLSYDECMETVLSRDLINRNSILIGHGLENDLNVMRIIHDKVIDTAILYSKGRLKTSLKNLAFEVLSTRIQEGEHDSSQDAIATMNVVKKKLGISLTQTEWD